MKSRRVGIFCKHCKKNNSDPTWCRSQPCVPYVDGLSDEEVIDSGDECLSLAARTYLESKADDVALAKPGAKVGEVKSDFKSEKADVKKSGGALEPELFAELNGLEGKEAEMALLKLMMEEERQLEELLLAQLKAQQQANTPASTGEMKPPLPPSQNIDILDTMPMVEEELAATLATLVLSPSKEKLKKEEEEESVAELLRAKTLVLGQDDEDDSKPSEEKATSKAAVAATECTEPPKEEVSSTIETKQPDVNENDISAPAKPPAVANAEYITAKQQRTEAGAKKGKGRPRKTKRKAEEDEPLPKPSKGKAKAKAKAKSKSCKTKGSAEQTSENVVEEEVEKARKRPERASSSKAATGKMDAVDKPKSCKRKVKGKRKGKGKVRRAAKLQLLRVKAKTRVHRKKSEAAPEKTGEKVKKLDGRKKKAGTEKATSSEGNGGEAAAAPARKRKAAEPPAKDKKDSAEALDKKKILSMKSSAYHTAARAAKADGKAPDEIKRIAKAVPCLCNFL